MVEILRCALDFMLVFRYNNFDEKRHKKDEEEIK